MVTLIACLDKEYPPSHSFVDGMLVDTLSRDKNIHVKLIVSQSGTDNKRGVLRYYGVICLAVLWTRRNLGRYLNFFNLLICLKRLIKKTNTPTILFVRNDPVLLLAAACMRHKVDRLVFQSSFPHEKYSGNIIKRSLAKFMYFLARNKVDAITAVSPLGLERTRKLFPNAKHRLVIPLLSDSHIHSADYLPLKTKIKKPVTFIYVGTCFTSNVINILVQSIVKFIKNYDYYVRFVFIGGTDKEYDLLRTKHQLNHLENSDIIKLINKTSRNNIFKHYNKANIGFSLYNKTAKDAERSPTKLTEYLGAGIAVVATKGIPQQEEFVINSQAGTLINLNQEELMNAMLYYLKNPKKLEWQQKQALIYAEQHLQYKNYLPDFKTLIGLG